jgi:magnesium chelatase subunit D
MEALCTTAFALGAGFVRAPLLALRAARASAALAGRKAATMEDAAIAARLVLAPRATRLPAESQEQTEAEPPPPEPPPENSAENPPENAADSEQPETEQTKDQPLPGADMVLEAAKASIPAGLLGRLTGAGDMRQKSAGSGKQGARQKGFARGRPVGVRAAPPSPGVRLNLIETLRAAAPWQRLRAAAGAASGAKIRLRQEDFRVTRTEQRTRSTTIFVVDASGSSALNRLAEAKGAVELLLADCYQRRDEVALLAFRGRDAKMLLPPTRSLVRAKRSLSSLPGGGGTPLAAGIDAGFLMAATVRRAGDTPMLVFLTDARANVSLSGTGGRAQAEQDAWQAGRRLRAAAIKTLLVDISPRPNEQARRMAREMGALYLPLPFAGAAAVSRAVRAAAKEESLLF